MSADAWLAASVLLAVAFWLPRYGLAAQLRLRRENQRKALYEDALKHVLTWQQRSQDATLESLAGHLELPSRRVVALVTQLSARGLLRSESGALRLTAKVGSETGG